MDDIRTITGRDVQPVVATSADVEQAIAKFAGLDSHVEQLAAEAAEGSEGEELDLEAALEDAPIVKLVNAIMSQAVAERASDVHIEPGSATSASGSGSTACSTSRCARSRRTSRVG